MWRLCFVLIVWLAPVFATLATPFVALQPWKAAEAVLRELPSTLRLKHVDWPFLKVFCGQQMKLGVQIDERVYDLRLSRESDWTKRDIPELTGSAANGEDTAAQEIHVDACVLSEVTLSGPLEIEWTSQTTARVVYPPEPYSIPHVHRLILEDGAEIRLSGLRDLSLQEPVPLNGLTREYFSVVYGKGGHGFSDNLQGLHTMSDALLRSARNGQFALKLQASAVPHGFTITHLQRSPSHITEGSPGVLTVRPSWRHCTERGVQEVPLQLWPFSEASRAHMVPYESLLQQVMRRHWRETEPETAVLKLTSAFSQAVALLRLQIEVRQEMGPTQLLDAMVLVHEGRYTPIQTQPIKADQYTTSLYPYQFMNVTMGSDEAMYDIYL